jgi:hypothetical protein
MILQSKEEPQLHTAMLIQDLDEKEPSSSHHDIPDCSPPPYSSDFVSGSAVVPSVTVGLANAPTVKTIRLEKHHESISGEHHLCKLPLRLS